MVVGNNFIPVAPFEPKLTSPTTNDILVRNSSGQWVNQAIYGVEAAANTPVAGANDTAIGSGSRKYHFFTMPTTRPFYIITGFEVLNGTVVNGQFTCGAELVDGDPPVEEDTAMVAWTCRLEQTGASGVQRSIAGQTVSTLIPSGAIIGAYIVSNSATARFGTTTVSAYNGAKTIAYSPDQATANSTAWSSSTEEPYIKVYVRSFL